jgi:hypothetical protein
MYGLDDSPIQNVVFENCTINAKTGFEVENVKDLDLSGLTIHVEEGEAIIQKNVE